MLLSLLAPFALSVPQDPIDLQLAARWFQEAKWCAEEDGGRLWGRSLEGPMLFVHAPSRTAVANREPPGMGLTAKDGLWTGKLPADVMTANTAFAWQGEQWSMVLWPLPNTRAERARLLRLLPLPLTLLLLLLLLLLRLLVVVVVVLLLLLLLLLRVGPGGLRRRKKGRKGLASRPRAMSPMRTTT